MSRRPARGTTALPAALAALAVSAALTAAIADVVRTEVVLVRHRGTAAAALAKADACLAAVLARLPAGTDFAPLLAPEAAPIDAPPGCRAAAAPTPGPAAPPRVRLVVEGRAAGGRRALEALVGRAPAPGVPALLWLAGPPTGSSAGRILLDGHDPADPDAPRPAAVAAPAPPEALDLWLAGLGRVATPGAGPPRFAPPLPLETLANAVGAAGAGGPDALGGPAPALALVDGDLTVTAPLAAAGLLLVRGTLDIADAFEFNGVVIASGGVRVRGGASLSVRGALWVGAPPAGDPLVVDGELRVRRDGAALAAADAQLALPRLAVLLGLRDLDG
ncbi:MAG TPA: hypothetical protein VFD84_15515 [Candidatus Binatia bacterium]|nr:hypothetical protein [Candidatus Binatia bacterium]